LNSGVEQLAGGDLGTRVEVRGSDEISVLAQGFNRMAEQLDEDQRRLRD
jgi:two-component system sensor histidine kinase BaeS